MAVSPSGTDVYIASSHPGALVHLCMDESTSELQAVDWEANAIPTGLRMDGASAVSVKCFQRHRVLPMSSRSSALAS